MSKLAITTKKCCMDERDAASSVANAAVELIAFVDPVESDTAGDKSVVMTDRQLARLITVAVETGCRFERESVSVDPLAWLYSPRKIFDGQTAVEACRSQTNFVRAILLHGLSIGLDAAPALMDELRFDEEESGCAIAVRPDGGALEMPVLSVG